MQASRLSWLFGCTFLLAPLSQANAEPYSFVVLKDDGTVKQTQIRTAADFGKVYWKVYDLYAESGAPMPEVISTWTTFNMGGDSVGTYFAPIRNDVKGIGVESVYGGDGTFELDAAAPLRAILVHNNFLALKSRARTMAMPEEGAAEYLFLLELSHLWGPAYQVPGANGNALIGFPFHWSFWLDSGGSPAGGNKWKDNGDGTFTTEPLAPKDVRFSKLDLYLMGLADPSEVPPVRLLENAVPPEGVFDPLRPGQKLGAASFPWWGSSPVTVQATARTFSMDDLMVKNGAREPTRASASTELSVGVVLLVAEDDTDDEIAQWKEQFEPFAASIDKTYAAATEQRGSLKVVTRPEAPPPAEETPPAPKDSGCSGTEPGWGVAALAIWAVARRRMGV